VDAFLAPDVEDVESTLRVSEEHPGLGFRVQGSGFRVQGSGFRVQDLGFRVKDSGFRVQGSGSNALSEFPRVILV
jgi:hypothetical protein